MDELLKKFFKRFFRENRLRIIWFSLWRMFAFCQVLFWAFAFSEIVDILTQNPDQWQKVVPWMAALVLNKILEDFVRLRSKYGINKIGVDLKLSLATFFTEKTEIKQGVKTGEAVQRVKKATETISNLATFYKDSFLKLPVNLLVIPFVLLKTDVSYFIILTLYLVLYLIIDYFGNTFYLEEAREYFGASETFWGTTYRKTPDVWREREDGAWFENRIEKEAEDLYRETITMENVNNWRWIAVQTLSSLFRGIIVVFVFYRITNRISPVGDLILVSSYFLQMQSSLNIITSSVRRIVDLRISLQRLEEALKGKNTGQKKHLAGA